MRRLLRAVARGEEITQDVSTLENPAIIDQLRGVEAPAPKAAVPKASTGFKRSRPSTAGAPAPRSAEPKRPARSAAGKSSKPAWKAKRKVAKNAKRPAARRRKTTKAKRKK
jgi:hypothetical protein